MAKRTVRLIGGGPKNDEFLEVDASLREVAVLGRPSGRIKETWFPTGEVPPVGIYRPESPEDEQDGLYRWQGWQ